MNNKLKSNIVKGVNLVGLLADAGQIAIPNPALQTLCKGVSIASHMITAGMFLKNKKGVVTMPALISSFFSTNQNDMVPYVSAAVHGYNMIEGAKEFNDPKPSQP